MDSDVSADGDVKSDHSEESPSSPDVNSDDESSSAASSPAADKNSSAESSPAAHKSSSAESSPAPHKASSSATSSPAAQNRRNSSRDSSPDAKEASSEKDSSPDTKASDHESSPPNSPSNSEAADSQDEDTKASASPDRESSPDLKECESLPATDAPESPHELAFEADRVPLSPEADCEAPSPEVDHDALSPQMVEYFGHSPDVDDQGHVSSPSPKVDHDALSPQMVEYFGHSPDVDDQGHVSSDRDQSPEAERESSPETKSGEYLNQSPDGRQYELVNGNASSLKRSNSVVSEGRSDIGSLDSVSPTQFEQHEETSRTNYDDDREGDDDDAADRIRDKKQAIIDFADDLSDVSDVESNESFGGQDKEEKTDGGEEEQEEEKKAESIHNESIHDRTNGEVLDDKHDDAVSLHVDGEEQLDFEAEEGEVSPKSEKKTIKEEEFIKHEIKEQSDLEEGELSDDVDAKPEETERPICRFFSRGHCTWGSNCRFIHPGVMDKGNYSMFETVRPIVTPGGPPNPGAPPVVYPPFPPHMVPPHIAAERAGLIPPSGPRKEEAPSESAWERGLRQAKEMIRKSSKRKETEVDFEDKKMNLTLSQDEIDKENDYYSRHSGSPPMKSPDLAEKWKMEADAKAHRAEGYPNDGPGPVGPHGADVPPLGYYPPLHHGMARPDYWNHHRMGGLPYEEYGLRGPHVPYGPDYFSQGGRRYMHPNSYYPPRPGVAGPPPPHHPDFYDRKQKHKPYPGSSREVIVQKNDKPYKDERYRGRREESPRADRGRDDEWADPWMRTKSPASGRRRRRRKNTYSSGSSYSSSSESSRSSGRSSASSRSHQSRSRSKGRSSGSGTHSSSRSASETQAGKKPPMQFKLSPTSRQQLAGPKKNAKNAPPATMADRRVANERAMLMNPVAASPKVKTRPHSPPTGINAASTNSPLKSKGGLPDRLLAHSKAAVVAAMRSTRSSDSHSSKSSSGSSSSDTASDSSDSSGSSSSSSKSSKTPPVTRVQKRSVEDHTSSAQMVKAKAMDALKLSGQKQQIKLTLKGSQTKRGAADNTDSRKERLAVAGKKRAADSSESGSDSDTPAKKSKTNQKRGGVPSRREELLKQLRAVEDAIARKRSKNV